jgi:hypothetical protein
MFERYTEKARRTIFFGRYEASQFGTPYIESEHLLLGLLREDKPLVHRVLHSLQAIESIRTKIEKHAAPAEKTSTSVDLPLSHESKRVLVYAAQEAQRLNHEHIGTAHLLLGLLREEKCFAAQLLREQGLTLQSVRERVQQSEASPARGGSAQFTRLGQWLADHEQRGGIRVVRQEPAGWRPSHFDIYPADPPAQDDAAEDASPTRKLADIRKRIEFIVARMENAIANHEFDKARFYSEEERKERENLRALREQFNLEEPPPQVPLLSIEIVRDDRLSEVQRRCQEHFTRGVAEVWLLEPEFKRAYTATKSEGLREFRGDVLRTANLPLEMDLTEIFA